MLRAWWREGRRRGVLLPRGWPAPPCPITLAPYLPTFDRASRHGFRRSRSPEIRNLGLL